MRSWVAVTSALLGLTVCGIAQQPAKPKRTWLEKQVVDRVQFSGLRSLGYQSFQFEGDADAFNSLTNFGTGNQRFTDIGNLSITGNKVLGLLDFRANFTDNRFADPEQQQYTLNYNRNGFDISYGTVQASLSSNNRFVNFSRSLEGVSAGFAKGRFATKVIRSETRGAARTVTVEGNNTTGPFYLQSGRIIPDTLSLRLDNEVLVPGKDFTLDLQLGTVTLNNRVVPLTSSLVATYESYDFAGQRGTIQGATVSYDFGSVGRLGFTSVEQLTGLSGGSSERQERSFGFGRPGDQYFLLFEPNPASIRITVNGIPRSFSVNDDGVSDFFLDARLPILIISRVAIPTNQEIIFYYTPKVVQTVAGDRKVSGWDYSIPLSDKGTSRLNYSQSTGSASGTNGSSGEARALDFRLNEGKGDLRANFRTISPGYSSIEQTGFNRNEDATEYLYNHFTKGFNTELKTTNSSFSFTDSSAATPVTVASRVITEDVSVSYRDPKNLEQSQGLSQGFKWNRTRSTGLNDNLLSTVTYTRGFQKKRLNYSLALENQVGNGIVSGGRSEIALQTYRARTTYASTQNLNFGATFSTSEIKLNSQRSTGIDYGLNINYLERGPWSANFDYTVSNSGALASLNGFLNGNALGFTNNGFSGSGGAGVLGTGALSSRRTIANITHKAGNKFVITTSIVNQDSSGLSTSNASIDTLLTSATYRVSENDTVTADWSRTTSNFISGSLRTATSDTLNLIYNGSRGNLNYSGGINIFQSGGDTIDQGSDGYNLDISYQLDRRQRVFYNFVGSRTRGFLPQNDLGFNAGYAYSIGGGLLLQGRYSNRNLVNLDPLANAGAFRSNGFSLELTFDFSGRR